MADVADKNLMRKANEELVEYTAPLLSGGCRQDVTVAVNGELVKIQRGAPVQIKRKFVKVLQDADRQALAAFQFQDQAQEAGRKAIANF